MTCLTLPYPNDSGDLFACFASWPFAIFLDSGLDANTHRRFDIISAAPQKRLISYGRCQHLQTDNHTHYHNDTLFDVLKTEIAHHPRVSNAPKHLPFTTGALGFMGYDVGHQLETLPHHRYQDIALPDAVIGLYDWSIVVDHQQQAAWLISSLDAHHNTITHILSTLKQPIPSSSYFQLQQAFKPCITASEYQQAFHQLKQHIRDGDCYQANLCQRFQTTYQGSPFTAYQHLRQHHSSPFSGFFHTPWGDILSHSPERFIRIQDRQVITQPIKGTAPRDADPVKDTALAKALLRSEKDRAENCMIVDLLRNDLARTCDAVDVPALCELHSFPNVHHLISTVTGQQQIDQHSLDTLKTCFPGGSITGAPKIRAMEILAELEPFRRSAYCGSLLYCDTNGSLDSNILIRTLLCVNNTLYAYAGGGIVHDSQADTEYQETLTKIGRLLQLLESTFLNSTKEPLC
ncbi:MAG TPA: aminodeoxychorismate synthase component I [Coxiellaceae bacterium]|nr:aminodeoxychorismate synthase component I [Coxiellaceae bacterium]